MNRRASPARTPTPALPQTPSLSLTLQVGSRISPQQDEQLWSGDRPRLRRLALSALSGRCATAALTLRLVHRQEGQALNRDYRGRDYPTNVLTFPYDQGPGLQADLVFCLPVIQDEAKAAGIALRDHLAHLVVHGCLHAAGLDHEDPDEAEAMEAEEVRLLRRFRIANPYEPAA